MGRVSNKVALVTGGASGIGKGCAEILAREGAAVIIADLQEESGLALAESLSQSGARAAYHRLDVTIEDDWVAVIGKIEREFGRLDILVNNAGLALACPSITDMALTDWRRQQAVNLDGVFLGVKHGLGLMRRAGHGGSIINMSSVAGLKGVPGMAGYAASKGAVRLFTKAVALECAAAKDGVRVNSVHPGMIETPIWRGLSKLTGPDGVNIPPDLDAISAATVPLGFKGLPVDIANGVLWLASEESRYVTGAELVIDGGASIR